MAIRNWDKERSISCTSCYKQIPIINRIKIIRKGFFPTVKLLFCIPDLHTVDWCPTILVILTPFAWKTCATLWRLFLVSKGKWAAPKSLPWGTQARGQPHNSTGTVPLTAVCSSKDGEEGSPVWLVTLPLSSWLLTEMAWWDAWLCSTDTIESGYKIATRNLHLQSQTKFWWIWCLWGLMGKTCSSVCAAAATMKSRHCC